MQIFDRSDLDESTAASANFYQYANGGWLKKNPLPSSASRNSIFSQLNHRTLKQIKDLIESAFHDPHKKHLPDYKKAYDFYASGMNNSQHEHNGNKTLQPFLEKVSEIQNIHDVLDHLALMHKYGVCPLFRFYSSAYPKESNNYEAYLFTAELPLKNPEHYWNNMPESSKIRFAYTNYINELLNLSDISLGRNKNLSHEIFRLESRIAQLTSDVFNNSCSIVNYEVLSFDELSIRTRSISWSKFFNKIGIPPPKNIIVERPACLDPINVLMDEIAISTWKTYLSYVWVRTAAPYLGGSYRSVHFHFFKNAVGGQKEIKPDWEVVTSTVSTLMGNLIGKLYIEKYFNDNLKSSVSILSKNILASCKDYIIHSKFSNKAKSDLIKRLETIIIKVGHPSHWKNYDDLEITPTNYLQNALNSMAFEMELNLSRLGDPVTNADWNIFAHSVNACYNSQDNKIEIPTALLQDPLFSVNGSEAQNYSTLGVIIAHEIIHVFQETSNITDGIINLNNWSASDKKLLKLSYNNLINQIQLHEAEIDIKNLSIRDLYENIADLGGLIIAVKAFEEHSDTHNPDIIDGFTRWQRFFISYARIWAQNSSDEDKFRQKNEDIHFSPETRVNLPLRNIPQFSQSFNILPGSFMYLEPDKQISI